MQRALAASFAAASPRFAKASTPARSLLIHGGALLLWIALLAMAFQRGGMWSWSVGVAYILYDTLLLGFVAWATLPILRQRPVRQLERPAVTLSVIIAAHNEAAVLPIALAAMFGQTDPPDRIVIADDGSSDGTARLLVERFGLVAPPSGSLSGPSRSHPTLCWLKLDHAGKAAALNAALVRTQTDTVLTVDADTLLDSGAIAAVRRAFSHEPELVAATGIIRPVCGRTTGGRIFEWFQTYEYIRNFLSRYAWARLNGLLLVSGAFAAFRLDAVRAVGGFDPECLVEDYEIIHRLHRHAQAHGLSWRVRVLGDAQATTDAPSGPQAFLRQRRRWFGGFLQTQYWYRGMVGDRRYGWLGTMMLPVKAIDTLQPLYGLAAFALLLFYLARGEVGVLIPVGGVIIAKIVLDLVMHLWFVRLYRRWTGMHRSVGMRSAFLAALAEPFTFQILRHAGAAWGWWIFLTGRETWAPQAREGVLPDAAATGRRADGD